MWLVCKRDRTTNFMTYLQFEKIGYGLEMGRRGANQNEVWRNGASSKKAIMH